ncbi:MAG TPA: S8 family serine peptidase, partial [Bacteroidales bacterium]|nr:S8 family serine peptidase [Bacteroidales bacterium]
MNKTLLIVLALFTFFGVKAQEQNTNNENAKKETEHDWFNQSPIDDQIYGAEIDKAYQFLQGKESKPVIVAVIDGGVDFNHEDLKGNMWINKDEIPDNGIDDDKNGYIDDIHGWNFLGNAEGENIAHENLEITRIYKKYNQKFSDVKKSQLNDQEKKLYALYNDAAKRYQKKLKNAQRQKEGFQKYKNKYHNAYKTIADVLQKDSIEIADLDSIKKVDKKYKKEIKTIYNFVKFGINDKIFEEIESHIDVVLDYHLNTEYNPRAIIGDDVTDMSENYGNNNVYGPEAFHGTFVSGIIAAKRDNDLGIDGIAKNAKIMALKVVPDGDERDKDVAKAIRYAVDNGARIINMSFGKDLSPYKYLVDEAVLYAQENDVLLVHAAGNDAYNIDKVKQYPTKITVPPIRTGAECLIQGAKPFRRSHVAPAAAVMDAGHTAGRRGTPQQRCQRERSRGAARHQCRPVAADARVGEARARSRLHDPAFAQREVPGRVMSRVVHEDQVSRPFRLLRQPREVEVGPDIPVDHPERLLPQKRKGVPDPATGLQSAGPFVGDAHFQTPAPPVTHVFGNGVAQPGDVHHHALRAGRRQGFQVIIDKGFASDGQQRLGDAVGKRPHALSAAGRQDHCPHGSD